MTITSESKMTNATEPQQPETELSVDAGCSNAVAPPSFIVRDAVDYWLNVRDNATREIMRLRDVCRHESRCEGTRDEGLGRLIVTVSCRDCGKFLGDV